MRRYIVSGTKANGAIVRYGSYEKTSAVNRCIQMVNSGIYVKVEVIDRLREGRKEKLC